ncbi:MAG: RluA family pseudouridine synthase [Deltaproteobacteria bacterium]|nr:RluA family pseudouridine synthase [Deltaproteobacteria bacterium]
MPTRDRQTDSPATVLHRLVVGRAEVGLRLDAFLARRFGRGRGLIRGRVRAEVQDASGHRLKWSHRLRAGEELWVPGVARPEPDVEVRFAVLHADDFVVAVDKGPGAPVHPVRSFRKRTVLTGLREALGDPTLKPAHRLDRETSGVLVFGRGRENTARLMAMFRARAVRKRYLAVVCGEPGFDEREIDLCLGRDPLFAYRVRMRPDPLGQPARTRLRVLRRLAGRALVAAEPQTGRQHQIRVHLAAIGHPVLGDPLYQLGGQPYIDRIRDALDEDRAALLGHSRLALHAERLELTHPQTGAPMALHAPLPEDLTGLLADVLDEGYGTPTVR